MVRSRVSKKGNKTRARLVMYDTRLASTACKTGFMSLRLPDVLSIALKP